MKADIYTTRQSNLKALLQENDLQAVILNPGPSLTYFTGLHFHLSERPVLFILSLDEDPIIILPELEAGKTSDLSYPVTIFTYGENPDLWSEDFNHALSPFRNRPIKLGMEYRQMRLLESNLISTALPDVQSLPAEDLIAQLRMAKSEVEIAHMRKAVQVAQDALLATLPDIRPGKTEMEVAALLTGQILAHGSQPTMPFSPIIASGPNSADPHAFPSDRVLQEGDLIIIDWGATIGGYYSDITRTFYLGEISDELKTIGEIVLQANTNARAMTGPGLIARNVDAAARKTIAAAGYGDFFIHRTGHGLGLDVHEPPYIHQNSASVLEEGMTFTIEPGIYLPGKGGVRIEDDVVYQDDQIVSLTSLPREVRRLA